ncbi:MAG: hypothetical protein VKJ24_08685, partial [Synechococcales bacterium]|nr:hypothetical protein [Synechococcales bacterium]
HSLQGHYSEAESLYLKSLTILMQHLGRDHRRTQTAWSNFVVLRQGLSANQGSQLSEHFMT